MLPMPELAPISQTDNVAETSVDVEDVREPLPPTGSAPIPAHSAPRAPSASPAPVKQRRFEILEAILAEGEAR